MLEEEGSRLTWWGDRKKAVGVREEAIRVGRGGEGDGSESEREWRGK